MRASVNSSVVTINPKKIPKEEPREEGPKRSPRRVVNALRLFASIAWNSPQKLGENVQAFPWVKEESEPRKSRGSALLGFSHTDIVDIFEKVASPTFTAVVRESGCSSEFFRP